MEQYFFYNHQIQELVASYGSPIYLYSKQRIEANIKVLMELCTLSNMRINYAVKANSNPDILKIILEHNMKVDSTGLGEVYINESVGFSNQMIYVVGNNFTVQELKELVGKNLVISIDSVDQLIQLGKIAPGYSKLMLRVNPDFGAGPNANVITGGNKTKFGIDYQDITQCLEIIGQYNLTLIGINQHIGSAYLEHESLIKGVKTLLDFISTNKLNNLKIINFGGGFGFNYQHLINDEKMNFKILKTALNQMFTQFLDTYDNPDVSLEFEPGRFIVANSAVLIGEVTSLKTRDNHLYVGTNLGFNNFMRPLLYNAYHHISFITENTNIQQISVVGNICESGDYLCHNRQLITPNIEDIAIVHDVGAYGYAMSSNFNSRLRPIEIMIEEDQSLKIIRPRETYEQLL